MVSGTAKLVRLLDRSVRSDTDEEKTQRLKTVLSEFLRDGSFRLPDRFYRPSAESYARRLLHRSEALGYTAVVMTWGPDQGTELHDHAGMWCVESVLAGEVEVTRYDLRECRDDLYRFERVEQLRAGVGACGSLIPPYEYHVLRNALAEGSSLTLHVYGGEMNHCNIYRSMRNGWYERIPRLLRYCE